MTWAAEITSRADVLYLDTETTGLGNADEIIEISALDNAGRVLIDTLIKPRRSIPVDAIAIHGISDQMVLNAPVWPDVYPLLLDLLQRYRHVVVYNAEFDRRLLCQTCAAHELPLLQARWHCAMKQYAALVGDRRSRFGGYRWFNLGDAVRRLGLTVVADHRALADARACRAVVHAMARLTPD
jgi:DNA polymerase-3 subunit epsilon